MSNIEELIGKIPWGEVLDAADESFDSDSDSEIALTKISKTIDNLINFEGLGNAGKLVEMVDDKIFRAAARVIISLAGDPERRSERRDKRKNRRSERKNRRAERKKNK